MSFLSICPSWDELCFSTGCFLVEVSLAECEAPLGTGKNTLDREKAAADAVVARFGWHFVTIWGDGIRRHLLSFAKLVFSQALGTAEGLPERSKASVLWLYFVLAF
jgi:hypothetical protein